MGERKKYFTYILLCSNDSYYVGHTSDIEKRLEAHNAGEGSSYTAKFRPVKLLYFEEYLTKKEAVDRELQLKGWTRIKKELLINNRIGK